MPAEPTKAKLKRRNSRKDLEEYRYDGGHSRELELKRNRGEVSCAECRRLKIKCDKQIPCQSCQRRGCAALCPNGSLSTGQGTRFVLAATEHLHKRIAKLSGRIRQLEDALAGLQTKHSKEPHPLLHEDLVHADDRDSDDVVVLDEGTGPAPSQVTDALDAFGTLSIAEHGISRFFGPTGGSESLLLANLDSNYDPPESTNTPETEKVSNDPYSLFSQSFPFTPVGQPVDVKELIESQLPPYEHTMTLCNTYFEQVSWLFRGVTRIQLIDDMLPVIYKIRAAPPGEDYSGPHDLALLFVIMAVGALVGEEPSNALGEHFHQISRAAISLQPILEKPSIVTIQTLHMMSIYNAMSGSDLNSETSMEMTWSLITLASHLSQTIGLHRDSARWGLTPKMVQRRRILFWDLFVADVWTNLNTGRPPSFSLAYIDCGYPQYSKDDRLSEKNSGTSFEIWQFRFAAECVAEVTARTLTAEAPSYTTIMELDRKVRDFPLPDGIATSPDNMAASFQRCVLDHVRETILMYIHRSFFAQAIIEHPANPLKSVYAPSFLAAYRASSTILKSVREQFNTWPNACSRFWTMWTFAFTAAVVFGTVVTRGPRSPLAQSAMTELDQACVLFSKAAVYSIRAAKALPILTKLNEKARVALLAAQNDPSPMSGDNGGLLWNIKQENIDDELSIFAGHTRFVSGKRGTTLDSSATAVRHAPVVNDHFQRNTGGHASNATRPLVETSTQWQDDCPPDAPRPPVNSSSYQPPTVIEMSATSNFHTTNNEWARTTSVSSSAQFMSSMDYSYSVPIRRHQIPPPDSTTTTPTYGWSNDPLSVHHHSQRDLPGHHIDSPTSYESHPPPQIHNLQHRQQQQSHPTTQMHSRQQQYHMHAGHLNVIEIDPPVSQAHYEPQYSPPAHSQVLSQAPYPQSSSYATYNNGTAYHSRQVAPTNTGLADLGLASRDSRLDERWSSFMVESGLLEDFS